MKWVGGGAPRLDRRWAVPVVTTLGIGLVLLIPLVVWGAVVRQTVVEDIARREADQRLLAARLARSSIDAAIDESGRRLGLFATRESLRAALEVEDSDALEAELSDLIQDTTYATALVLDGRGRLLARHPAAAETYGQSFADRDYYQGALKAEGPYVSEAVVSRITGQTLVVVARAVRAQQLVLGLILVTLTPTELLSLLEPLRSTPGREIHLVDQRSRVIASTDPARTPLSDIRFPDIEQTELAQTGSTMGSIDGVSKVVTYAPIRAARWTLLVSDDPSVLLAAQRELERQLIVGGAATTLLALLAAAGIAWLYTTSLRQRAALADREAALQGVNEELAAASRHKSEFLAGMSHELRTPLNAILGFSELLDEQLATVTTDRQKRYLQNVRDAGQHLLALINDVLDLSKVEAGRVDLRPEATTLDALTAPVISSTRASAEAQGLRFRAEVDRRLEVTADVSRIRQILYNLLSNAIKFTPSGGEVAFRAGRSAGALRFEIRDTGIGIPAEKRDLVFGSFERLHEGRSDAPGTGLGLALTKSLVELHGGTITFESPEGVGTVFRVTLPNLVVESAPADRLLVVEDERRDAELIVALATSVGLRTEVVSSVPEARAAIGRALPCAVVLDLHLRGEHGERVLEALRADPATRDVPVVIVTVEDDDGRTRLLGADDHLTKPLDRARLIAWLERIAGRTAREEAPPATTAS